MIDALQLGGIKQKTTVKSLISAGLTALAAALPLIFHTALGAEGGARWLPMYAPVIIGGCLLGSGFGLVTGIMSCVASYLISQSVIGIPMPSAQMLPAIALELAVFGAVSGLFGKIIVRFPAVCIIATPAAQAAGKGAGFIYNIIVLSQYVPFWDMIQKCLPGLCVQIVILPLIIIPLAKRLKNERN
ncbi:MAG: hypothetical protein ACOYIQ_05185 [Christensenellales bacterium]|jgi:hypothetical protein